MRFLTKLGVTLAAIATLVATTAGVASAATKFKVDVHHSSGALAASSSGTLTWSTSGRTVTISNGSFFAKGGEWASIRWEGFQGNSTATPVYVDSLDQRGLANRTKTYGPSSMTLDLPGGIAYVRITVRDIDHNITELKNCYRSMTTC